jgi:hypothetical protein
LSILHKCDKIFAKDDFHNNNCDFHRFLSYLAPIFLQRLIFDAVEYLRGISKLDSALKREKVAELRSLGVDPRRISEMNDAKELEDLTDLLKQSLIEEYRTAYGERGTRYEEEAKATSSKF